MQNSLDNQKEIQNSINKQLIIQHKNVLNQELKKCKRFSQSQHHKLPKNNKRNCLGKGILESSKWIKEIFHYSMISYKPNEIFSNNKCQSFLKQILCANKIYDCLSKLPNQSSIICKRDEFIEKMVGKPILNYDLLVFMLNNNAIESVIVDVFKCFEDALIEIQYPSIQSLQISNTKIHSFFNNKNR